MCNNSCINFGIRFLREEYVRGKRVIEVGSFDQNGSLRSIVRAFSPSEYIGVDIENGPGVDQICVSEKLIKKYGRHRFDVVISTEMLEHVRNWKKVIHNLKQILSPGGLLLITTRSRGFPFHGFPFDFWRFEISDIKLIFSDFEIHTLESDPEEPGIFLLARKPRNFIEKSIDDYKLYSMILNRHSSVAVATICFPFKIMKKIIIHMVRGDILLKISARFKK